MQTKQRRNIRLRAAYDSGTAERTFRVIASTPAVNTHGYSIDQTGWDLSRFTDGGPVLLEHGAAAGCGITDHDPALALPIGRATNVRVEGGQLRAEITICSTAAHPLADMVLAAIRERTLTGISVGLMEPEGAADDVEGAAVLRRAILLEISVCAIPADPGARIELAASRGPRLRLPAPVPATAREVEAYRAMTLTERLQWGERDPDGFASARLAASSGVYRRPAKPYARMSPLERLQLAERDPHTFSRARRAGRKTP